MKPFWVYIMASQSRVLGACPGLRSGVGVTNDLARRVAEHKAGQGGAFTRRYRVHHLVYAEDHPSILDAIAREKSLKGKSRAK